MNATNHLSAIGWLALVMICLALVGIRGSRAGESTEQRDAVQYRLENRFNELELLIRNDRADQADIRWQKREFAGRHLNALIPIGHKIDELRKQLERSARANLVHIRKFESTVAATPGAEVPKSAYIDAAPVKLTDEQLAETINLKIGVEGSRQALAVWLQAWTEEISRLLELQSVEPVQSETGGWLVRAQAFSFKNITFPRLLWRDPAWLVPVELKSEFAPLLNRIRSLGPKAMPFYDRRREFLLNQARLDFHSKLVRRISSRHATFAESGSD